MAVTYGFFDAVYDSGTGTYDRTYTAEQMSMYFNGLVSDGVIANVGQMLVVTPGTGMAVQVGTGRMIIDSRWIQNDTVFDLSISTAHATMPRKDIVVARLDYSGRAIGITVKAGTAAATPTAPAVQRDSTYYEMELAEILVPAGATAITASNITDKRADQTVCGYVTGLVDQIDTAGMWSQLEADFGAWFDEMKDQLSEDAAGNLQLQIDDLQDASEAAADTLTDLTGTQVTTTPTGTDLNTLTNTGIYQIGDLSQMINGPLELGYGTLEVNRSRTYILQRFINMRLSNGVTEYMRASVDNGATWRPWHVAQTGAFIASTTSFESVNSTYIKDYRLAAAKIGRMCFISGYFTFGTTAAPAETLFATLPAAFRPWIEWTVLGTVTNGASANQARNMLLKTNGQLIIHNWGTPASTWLRFEAAYVSAS